MRKLLALLLVLAASFAVAQTTPNYGFNVPPFNTQNWGTLMNQNWYYLDTLLLTAGGGSIPTPGASGLCFVSTGIIPGAYHWATCPGGGGGFVNPMTAIGDFIQGGSAGAAVRLPGPATYDGVPQTIIETASGGVPGPGAWAPGGVIPNLQTGTSYTILLTDRLKKLTFSNASAIAVGIPQAGTANFDANFAFVACDAGAGTATFTPAGTSTISYAYTGAGTYTTSASSMPLTTGQCAFFYSDNANYGAIRIGGSSGGGGGTSTELSNCVSDQTGNSNYTTTTLTNIFDGGWNFTPNTTTYFNCEIYIVTAQTGATLVVDVYDNDTSGTHTASFQTCDVFSSSTLQVGSLTCATAQTWTATSTAYQRVQLTFNVQSTLSNNGTLFVKIGVSPSGAQPSNNLIVHPHFIL